MGYRFTRKSENMNPGASDILDIADRYQPLIESWEPKENTVFVKSKCRELIGFLEKTMDFNLYPFDMRKKKEKDERYVCENGQSVLIDSAGKKLFVQFIKDLNTNEELRILLKMMREDGEKYEHSIIILIGETNPAMPEKIDKFIENNKIPAALMEK